MNVAKGYSRDLYNQIKSGWDRVAKPLDSMGIFEEVLSRIGAIQGRLLPDLKNCRLIVCCADNGIVEEGVSQSGQEITAICADSIANGRSSVAIMAKEADVDVLTLDVGINTSKEIPGVRDVKIAQGTRNFLKEPAMTKEECQKAIELGQDLVEECKWDGYSILAIGEMGIGNTTTSSAVTAALLGMKAEEVTGRGAGLNDQGFLRKQEVIKEALRIYGYESGGWSLFSNQGKNPKEWTKDQVLDVLCNLGGFDIACMVGICLGGAMYDVPIVLDGFISQTAALVACKLDPVTADYLIPSHSGKEQAMKCIEKELGLNPVIHANMALGEGTGAVLMVQLLRTANAVYASSQSFDKAGISQYVRYEKESDK